MEPQVLPYVRALETGPSGDLRHVAVGRLGELRKVELLELIERLALGVVVAARRARIDDLALGLGALQADGGGDVERLSLFGERKRDGDRVSQLAHVARPVVAKESIEGRPADATPCLLRPELLEERTNEERNVVEALAER